MNLSIVLELVLTLLLAVTVVYCIILERRLAGVKKGQQALGATVRDLNAAILRAGDALASLKAVSGSAAAELEERVRRARALSDELELLTASGERIADRFDRAISAKKPAGVPEAGAAQTPPESIMQRLDSLRTVR